MYLVDIIPSEPSRREDNKGNLISNFFGITLPADIFPSTRFPSHCLKMLYTQATIITVNAKIALGFSAPCNNTCDLFREMHLAPFTQKPAHKDPTVVPAESVLEMATINRAKAIGLDKDIDSLEVGKKADFVAIDMNQCHLQPWFSPVGAVVYSVTGKDVKLVLVDAKMLSMNEAEIVAETKIRIKEVAERAGLTKAVSGQ